MDKEKLASLYSAHHTRGARYGYLYCNGERGRYLQEWIGKGKKVLDLGCRDGMLTSFYASGNEVVGVDIDPKALEKVKSSLGIEALWLDLNREWPFEKEQFDVIVACEILEHLFDLDGVLAHIAETLRPGGLFIGSVPNAFRLRNRWKFLWGKEYETDPTHVRQFSKKKLETILQKRFSSIEIIPLQGMILPKIPVSPSLPKGIGALFAKDLLWKSSQIDFPIQL